MYVNFSKGSIVADIILEYHRGLNVNAAQVEEDLNRSVDDNMFGIFTLDSDHTDVRGKWLFLFRIVMIC